jgi:hypothetical protein
MPKQKAGYRRLREGYLGKSVETKRDAGAVVIENKVGRA